MFKQKILNLLLIIAIMLPFNAKANTPDFADLAEELLPMVVNIATTQKVPEQNQVQVPELNLPEGSPFEDFFKDFMEKQGNNQNQQPISSLGSGFIIDAKLGYVVTNNHVVQDADEIKVILHDETSVDAKIVGTDSKTDLAVLKIDPIKGMSNTKWGDSNKMRVGNWVMAIGNPFGLGGTVTTGIISARHRDINAGPYDNFIQSDASINRGNSGGPMFNLKGEVIGINTAIFSPTGGSVGIGFAIPSNLAKSVIGQLIKYGETKRGWLGVKIQTVTDEIATSFGMDKAKGALVSNIIKDSPAAKAGVKPGDIIIEFNTNPVKDMRELPRMVAETDIGKTVEIAVWRNKARVALKVNLGQLEKAEKSGITASKTAKKKPVEKKSLEINELGISLSELDGVTRKKFDIDNSINGVIITKVNPTGSAAQKGIRAGDIITEFDQTEVTKPAEIKNRLEKIKKDKRSLVLVYLNRSGNMRFVGLAIKSDDK